MNATRSTHEGEHRPTVKRSNLRLRLASSAILLTIALGAAYLGGIMAGVVAGIFVSVVLVEWATITRQRDAGTMALAVAVGVATLMTVVGSIAVASALALSIAVVAAIYSRSVWLFAGVIYASALGISLVGLRVTPELGFEALLFVLVVVWATDSGAFVAGRTIGGPKLAPRISPKKTWAGAIGGLVSALVAAIAAGLLMRLTIGPELIVVVCGLSVAGQLGDLFESSIKRHFGAKDSGHMIPGHGGVMDRVDALTFAATVALIIGVVHGSLGDLGRGLLVW